MMEILETVSKLNLPDWWIGAGFVRSKVWDHLHGYTKRTPIPDIDVIYFNPKDFANYEAEKFSTIAEDKLQKILKKKEPKIKWSVTNQARMHLFHNHKPYKNSSQALSFWVETATCIGVRLDKNKEVILTAPLGIEDLVNLVLRPTKDYENNRSLYEKRIKEKEWIRKWPKLKVV